MISQTTETLDRRVIAGFRQALPADAPDIAGMLIDQFTEEAASQVERLRAAVHCADQAAVKAVAHSLKGSSMTMGAMRLAGLCTAMEAQVARHLTAANVEPLMTELVTELDQELVNLRNAFMAERAGIGQ